MDTKVKQQIENLKSVTSKSEVGSIVKEIAHQEGVSSLLKEAKSFNTFKKAEIIHFLKPDLKKENLSELLDLLEAEAKPIIGREEATVHSALKKNLFEKISELYGEDVFEGVSTIDEQEIKSRIESIRKNLSNKNPNA